jgi:hypothetical protein
MIVEEGGYRLDTDRFSYRCVDPVKEDQRWSAYEFDTYFGKPNNWRIATDDDIANYVAGYVQIGFGKVGNFDVRYLEKGIMLVDSEDIIILDQEELIQLKQIIEERIGV